MENNKKEFEARAPDYQGSGVAIWKAIDQHGKTFLKVKVLGGKTVNCFKVEPKVEKLAKEEL